jgi:sugar phosphate permease
MTAAFDNGLVKVRTDEGEIGAKTALRSRLFWHVALAYVLLAMIGAAVITHVMPYLSTIGSTRATATKVAMAIPLISIAGRLSFGWLGDKLDRTKIAVACYALVALGLVSFEYVSIPGSWPLLFFLILFSIGLGGVSALRPALVRQIFGRSSFGTILGLIAAMIAIGSTSGAAWPGWVFDNWGSYKGTWLALSVVAVVALLSMVTIPTARRRSSTP